MTPILYDKSAIDFTNLGIGVLAEAVSCVVTEKRNGSFECELVYPVSGALYSYIDYDSIIKAKPNISGDDQLFRVYKYSKPSNGLVTFSCEHASYELSRAIFSKISSSLGKTAAQIYTLAVAAAPYVPDGFTFTSEVLSTTGINMEYKSIRAAIFEARDLLGGELEWNNRSITLHESRGSDTGIIIAYGKNLTDITAEGDITDLCTALYPYAIDDDDNTVTLSPKLLTHENNSSYAYTRVVAVDLTDEISGTINAANLLTAANAYMAVQDIFSPEENINITFEPLGNTMEYSSVAALETVSLCDTVTVRHGILGLNVSAKVITTVFDVLRERYNSVELGTRKSDLYNTFSKIFDVEELADEANTTANAALAAANSLKATGMYFGDGTDGWRSMTVAGSDKSYVTLTSQTYTIYTRYYWYIVPDYLYDDLATTNADNVDGLTYVDDRNVPTYALNAFTSSDAYDSAISDGDGTFEDYQYTATVNKGIYANDDIVRLSDSALMVRGNANIGTVTYTYTWKGGYYEGKYYAVYKYQTHTYKYGYTLYA